MKYEKLKKWLINKKDKYKEIATNSMSDSYAIKYMAKSTAIKEVLNYIKGCE